MTKLSRIKPEWMTQYLAREMTSTELARLYGYAAPYLRRAIPREPMQSQDQKWREDRRRLRQARTYFQNSIAKLPIDKICEQANVSRSTAARIRKRNQGA